MPLNALLLASRRTLSADPAIVVAAHPFGSFVGAPPTCFLAAKPRHRLYSNLRDSGRPPFATPPNTKPQLLQTSQFRWYTFDAHRETPVEGDLGGKRNTIVIKHKGWSSVRQRWQNLPINWKRAHPLGKRRDMKERHRSPNEYLIRVLSEHGDAWKLPRIRPGKANLSYVRHDSPHDWSHPDHLHPYELFRTSLQFYLARYLRKVYRSETPDWDTPIAAPVQNWLGRLGYTQDDFRIWGKILTAEDALTAANVLLDGKADGMAISRPAPIWILTLLSRRLDGSARTVRSLIEYVGTRVTVGSERTGKTFRHSIATDEKTFILICIRLLRKARIVHPDSIEDITNLFVARINPLHAGTVGEPPASKPGKQERLRKQQTRLTLLYNKMLSLLSLPTSLRPVVSTALQQRAQFIILRGMSEYQPPLTITQQGYRGIARVQIAQLKTKEERKWAELKSNLWPPWKVDRTAMDSDIGPEQGLSRAGQSILRMNEAGYPTFGWDRIVQLFAGWDADGSPVIQHRKVLARVQSAIASALNEGEMARKFPCMRDVDHEVWAARVRTTSTVEQSWAIFLAYDALEVHPPQKRMPAYEAMFERIMGVRKLLSGGRQKRAALQPGYVDKKEEVPGDAREPLPTPDSPHERLDPRLRVPSIDQLLERMISRGIYPDDNCLALLLQAAKRIDRGLNLILSRGDRRVRALLELHITDEQVEAVPLVVFNAYIHLLCRFCWVIDCHHFVDNVPKGDGRAMIHRAIALMDRRRSKYRPGWNRLLLAVHKFDSRRNGTTTLIRQTLKVLDNAGIELDAEGFQIVCFAFGFRALVRRGQLLAQDKEQIPEDTWELHLQHNDSDSRFLRALFSKLVGLGDVTHLKPHLTTARGRESATVPTALSVPPAVVLHKYIRALGIMGDYEGLLSVACFMHDNVAGLLHHRDNELNGHVRLRRTVVALRCFLERSWDDQCEQLSSSNAWTEEQELDEVHELHALDEVDQPVDERARMKFEPAPEELSVLVRDKVEDLAETWGPWPSDDELQEYVDWVQMSAM